MLATFNWSSRRPRNVKHLVFIYNSHLKKEGSLESLIVERDLILRYESSVDVAKLTKRIDMNNLFRISHAVRTYTQ